MFKHREGEDRTCRRHSLTHDQRTPTSRGRRPAPPPPVAPPPPPPPARDSTRPPWRRPRRAPGASPLPRHWERKTPPSRHPLLPPRAGVGVRAAARQVREGKARLKLRRVTSKPSQAKLCQVESSQVKSSQVRLSPVQSSQAKSEREGEGEMDHPMLSLSALDLGISIAVGVNNHGPEEIVEKFTRYLAAGNEPGSRCTG